MEHRQIGYLRKYFKENKSRTNTAKKVGFYFILFSVLNSEVSLTNLMPCATKYFVLIFRDGLNCIIRFTNGKNVQNSFGKVSILLQKAANLGML